MQIHSFTPKHNNSPTFGKAVHNRTVTEIKADYDEFASSYGETTKQELSSEDEKLCLKMLLNDKKMEYEQNADKNDTFMSISEPDSFVTLINEHHILIFKSTMEDNNLITETTSLTCDRNTNPVIKELYTKVIDRLNRLKLCRVRQDQLN